MKKIVFVLSLLALTGSVVTSCSKDREEVATQKADNIITKENLVASGKFVITRLTILDESGKVLKTKKPGDGLDYYNATIFKRDGTYTSFVQEKSTDEIDTEDDNKYELEGNKLTIYDENVGVTYEIVEFVKGKYLKLKDYDVEKDASGKEQKVTEISEFEVK